MMSEPDASSSATRPTEAGADALALGVRLAAATEAPARHRASCCASEARGARRAGRRRLRAFPPRALAQAGSPRPRATLADGRRRSTLHILYAESFAEGLLDAGARVRRVVHHRRGRPRRAARPHHASARSRARCCTPRTCPSRSRPRARARSHRRRASAASPRRSARAPGRVPCSRHPLRFARVGARAAAPRLARARSTCRRAWTRSSPTLPSAAHAEEVLA